MEMNRFVGLKQFIFAIHDFSCRFNFKFLFFCLQIFFFVTRLFITKLMYSRKQQNI